MGIKPIKFKIKTESNCFIGGSPQGFEIGGIDQYTVVDHDHKPFIPASSFKGAYRTILRNTDSAEVSDYYYSYLIKMKERVSQLDSSLREKFDEEYDRVMLEISATYLLGVEGFNGTPKLLFSDLRTQEYAENCFSIDSKNSIGENPEGTEVSANPRTYKAIRKGIVFEGDITFYKFNSISDKDGKSIRTFVSNVLLQFNQGIYRIGNSKSRGYGKISVTLEESQT